MIKSLGFDAGAEASRRGNAIFIMTEGRSAKTILTRKLSAQVSHVSCQERDLAIGWVLTLVYVCTYVRMYGTEVVRRSRAATDGNKPLVVACLDLSE